MCTAIVAECQRSFCAHGCLGSSWAATLSLDCSKVPYWHECVRAEEELRAGAADAIVGAFRAEVCRSSAALGCCAADDAAPALERDQTAVTVAMEGPLAGLPVRRLPLGACAAVRRAAAPGIPGSASPTSGGGESTRSGLFAGSRQEAEAAAAGDGAGAASLLALSASALQRGRGPAKEAPVRNGTRVDVSAGTPCRACLAAVSAEVFADDEACLVRARTTAAEEALRDGPAADGTATASLGEGGPVGRCRFVAAAVRRNAAALRKSLARGACACMGCCGGMRGARCFLQQAPGGGRTGPTQGSGSLGQLSSSAESAWVGGVVATAEARLGRSLGTGGGGGDDQRFAAAQGGRAYDVDGAWAGTGLGSAPRGVGDDGEVAGEAWLQDLAERAGREALEGAMRDAHRWAP